MLCQRDVNVCSAIAMALMLLAVIVGLCCFLCCEHRPCGDDSKGATGDRASIGVDPDEWRML